MPHDDHHKNESTFKSLSTNKMRHIIEVSRLMYESALRMGWSEDVAQEMAVLGFMHDIGYMFHRDGHSQIGGDILARTGYEYAEEVTNHGNITAVPSPAQALLWHADMSVGPHGERVSYDERMEDIERRYGADSNAYKNVLQIVRWLEEHFPCDYVLVEHGGKASSVPVTGEEARRKL